MCEKPVAGIAIDNEEYGIRLIILVLSFWYARAGLLM